MRSNFYQAPPGREILLGVAELREHPARHLHIRFPAHLVAAKLSRYLVINNRRQHTHGKKVWSMTGFAIGTTPTGPECIDKAKLLAGVEDLARLLVHEAEDLRGLINGKKVILGQMSWARCEGTKMILHSHGESPKIVTVCLAQGDIDEDVHRTINQVFQALRPAS